MSNETIAVIVILAIAYIVCRLFPKGNSSMQSGSSNKSCSHNYRVRGTYHSSGMTHAFYEDALAEAEVLQKKYPDDVFFVYDD